MTTFPLTFTVNEKLHRLEIDPHERLIDVLRDRLGLKGVKEGCGTGDCGSCVIILNGRTINSCLMLAVQARNGRITTIEGIGSEARPHVLQRMFVEQNATACGFCIPGIILTAKVLLDKNPDPSESEIRQFIRGNLCRCTGYARIVQAIQLAARSMR